MLERSSTGSSSKPSALKEEYFKIPLIASYSYISLTSGTDSPYFDFLGEAKKWGCSYSCYCALVVEFFSVNFLCEFEWNS